MRIAEPEDLRRQQARDLAHVRAQQARTYRKRLFKMTAQLESTCARCLEPVRPGDTIRRGGKRYPGCWLHVGCTPARDAQ